MRLSLRRICTEINIYHKNVYRQMSAKTALKEVDRTSEQLKTVKDIPGPSSLPFIGQMLHFLPGGLLHGSYGNEMLAKLHKSYGPIVKFDSAFGSPMMVILFDPDAIGHILHAESWMQERPGFPSLEYYRHHYKKQDGERPRWTGLVTDRGEVWREFRSKVNPVMMKPQTIKLYNKAIDEVAQDMVVRMKSIRDEKNMITKNFDVEMNLWALESIGVVALGRRLNCFNRELAADSPERQLIQCVHDIFITSEQLDWQPNLWRYYSTKKFKKAMKLYETQEKLTRYFVNEAIKEINKNQDNLMEEKSILEKLLEMDEQIAVIMASDMLFAGVDTAANTMSATLYLLAMNKEKQKKLRDDLINPPDKRRYLKACIKEAMRMMPVVNGNLRMLTKSYNLLGYHLPKGLYVSFVHHYLSMSDEEYPRANEYIPERWLVDKDDPLYHGNAHSFAFSPFGFGARSCIGRRIAELEVETFLGRVIENFQLDWVGQRPNIKVQSLNYFVGPFHYVLNDVK